MGDPNEILGPEHGAYALRQAFRAGQLDGVRSVSQLQPYVTNQLEALAAGRNEEDGSEAV